MIEPLLQAERLLLHGMVDQAEELYRRTAEQDPRNAIAVVGLARVALERGDDELALTHARAALAIDPQNAAAIRLEVRLTEVLAARAERGGAEQAAEPGAQATDAGPAPAWSSTAPPAAPSARPSEQTIFSRNPTMAEHRRRTEAQAAGEPRVQAPARPAEEEPARRPGLIERLLRRDRQPG